MLGLLTSNYSTLVDIFTVIHHPKSTCNCCVINIFYDVFPCFPGLPVDIRVCVNWLCPISFCIYSHTVSGLFLLGEIFLKMLAWPFMRGNFHHSTFFSYAILFSGREMFGKKGTLGKAWKLPPHKNFYVYCRYYTWISSASLRSSTVMSSPPISIAMRHIVQ